MAIVVLKLPDVKGKRDCNIVSVTKVVGFAKKASFL